MIISQQIAAVTRRVNHADLGYSVEVEQSFDTASDEVWKACTDPERLRLWFEAPEGQLEEGGRYTLADSGTQGTIERCERPRALQITREFGGDSSSVEVYLTAVDDRTTLSLHHIVAGDDHWSTFGPAATGIGWDGSLLALSLFLAGDERAHPQAMAVFNASEEGKRFIDLTAQEWRKAHLELGADPEVARESAQRTADFYRGGE